MAIFIKIVQLILCLSILITIHEFGHFIAAIIFKTRVNKFYLFFNYKFSLISLKRINGKLKFKFFSKNLPDSEPALDENGIQKTDEKGNKLFKRIDTEKLDKDDWRRYPDNTEFGLGWIPFGGYCQIDGMVDETQDKEKLSSEPQPWEFRSKPAWQRLIIILGGVIMNIIAAIVIYIGLTAHYGTSYLPNENVKYGIVVDSLGYELGLRNGDFIVSVNNEKIEDFYKIPQKILIDQAENIQVKRNGEVLDIAIPKSIIGKIIQSNSTTLISPRLPSVIGFFTDNSPAKRSGLKIKDKIIAVDDISTVFFDEFKSEISKNKGKTVNIAAVRDSDTLYFPVDVSPEGVVGLAVETTNVFEVREKDYTLLAAIPVGFKQGFSQIGSYLKSLRLLFIPEAKGIESLGSFISIGNIFPSTWNWNAFWHLTAFISIILAIMNVLPIPALDGGYAILILYEMITRRKPSDKFMEKAVTVGWIILIALLLLATWNDFAKYIFKIR